MTLRDWLEDHPPPDAAFTQTLAGVFDAYLGALSEHLAIRYELAVPPWTQRPSRFLDRFWFVSPVPGFRAIAVAQSPASFRRRAIFIARGSMERC
jgi:hypothetical protein